MDPKLKYLTIIEALIEADGFADASTDHERLYWTDAAYSSRKKQTARHIILKLNQLGAHRGLLEESE